jgi:secondary thiamine-phosphate synthase enzyme
MHQFVDVVRIRTAGRGLTEITPQVADWLHRQEVRTGLMTLFCRHTSAGLLVQENAAPEVRLDLEAFFQRMAPEGEGRYLHSDEGADDMPAHIRTALNGVNLSIPVIDRRLALGTWQGIYLFEHRRAPGERDVALHLIGE